MRHRRISKLMVGLMILAVCITDLGRSPVQGQDETNFEQLERKIRDGEFGKEDLPLVKSLNSAERRELDDLLEQSRFKPRHHAPDSSSDSTAINWFAPWIATVLGIVLLFVLVSAKRENFRSDSIRRLMNRVAQFRCPDCDRPICLIGTSHATIQKLSREDFRSENMDESSLTTHQKFAAEPVWIIVRCIHCDKEICYDEVGQIAATPQVPTSSSPVHSEERPSPETARA